MPLPNHPATMNPQNPEEWWAERCAHIAELMKNTGVGELIIRRKADGKYSFELTPEAETNTCPRCGNLNSITNGHCYNCETEKCPSNLNARWCDTEKRWRIPGDRCLACNSQHNKEITHP